MMRRLGAAGRPGRGRTLRTLAGLSTGLALLLAGAPGLMAEPLPAGAALATLSSGALPQARMEQSRLTPPEYRLQPERIADGVYVLLGPLEDFSPANGCNIINTGFIVGDSGVVVINTGPSRLYGEQMRKAIARVTDRPVVRVLNLNLHPDYFLGNQAFADVPVLATQTSISGMQAEGKAYEDNLYRLCGDWMKDTSATPAAEVLRGDTLSAGGRTLDLIEYTGHTPSDLVVIDRQTGVMFAGGLVFIDRVPTTPHADLPAWIASLEALLARPFSVMVPSHGVLVRDRRGVQQTLDYLRWLDRTFSAAARNGLEMTEVLAIPMPERFRGMGARQTEWVRNVTHLYPRYERAVLQRQ